MLQLENPKKMLFLYIWGSGFFLSALFPDLTFDSDISHNI